MNKAQLIDAIAADANVSKTEAGRVFDIALKCITKALASGEAVALVGFGSFLTKKRPARIGRNPKTGEALNIPEAIVPLFKPGKVLKDSVNIKEGSLAAELAEA